MKFTREQVKKGLEAARAMERKGYGAVASHKILEALEAEREAPVVESGEQLASRLIQPSEPDLKNDPLSITAAIQRNHARALKANPFRPKGAA